MLEMFVSVKLDARIIHKASVESRVGFKYSVILI